MRADKAEAHASAAGTGEGGRNLPGTGAGAEAGTAEAGETKPGALRLMEAVVERSNMLCAYERVVANEGAPGVDGLTVAELKPWLKAHWAKVRQALLADDYMPSAVGKVEIPKPQGGVRTLGIPTVVDRLIQQALHQMMQPEPHVRWCGRTAGATPPPTRLTDSDLRSDRALSLSHLRPYSGSWNGRLTFRASARHSSRRAVPECSPTSSSGGKRRCHG